MPPSGIRRRLYHVALGASGTALLHTVAVSLGERFFGE